MQSPLLQVKLQKGKEMYVFLDVDGCITLEPSNAGRERIEPCEALYDALSNGWFIASGKSFQSVRPDLDQLKMLKSKSVRW